MRVHEQRVCQCSCWGTLCMRSGSVYAWVGPMSTPVHKSVCVCAGTVSMRVQKQCRYVCRRSVKYPCVRQSSVYATTETTVSPGLVSVHLKTSVCVYAGAVSVCMQKLVSLSVTRVFWPVVCAFTELVHDLCPCMCQTYMQD